MPRTKSNNSKQNNSSYQSLYLWTSFLLGMISLGIVVWHRKQTSFITPVKLVLDTDRGAGIQASFSELLDSHLRGNDNFFSHADNSIFSYSTPLILSALAYQQSGNSAVSFLSSLLLFAPQISAQPPGFRTVLPEFQANTNGSSVSNVAIAGFNNSESVVAWEDINNIYAQRYAGNGMPLTSAIQISIAGGASTIALQSFENTGEWIVVYARSNNMYLKRYARDNTVLVPELLLNTNTTGFMMNPAIAKFDSGGYVVAWRCSYQVCAKIFAANNTPLAPEFQVNTAVISASYYVDLATFPSDEWTVVWDGNSDVFAKRYAGNGAVLIPDFRLNTNATGIQLKPVIARFTSAQWAAAWQDNRGGSGYGINMRWYTQNNTPISENLVNTFTAGNQYGLGIVTTPSDDCVVLWDGYAIPVGGDVDVFARVYTKNAIALSAEFPVNTPNNYTQWQSAVTSFDSGEIGVAWADNRQLSSYNAYATIFTFTPSVTTASLTLATTSSRSTQTTLGTTAITPLAVTQTTSKVASTSTSLNSGTSTMSSATQASIISETELSALTTSADSLNVTQVNTGVTTANDTQTDTTPAVDKSGNQEIIIAGAAGGGGLFLAICFATVGFFACRNKSRANKSNDTELKNSNNISEDQWQSARAAEQPNAKLASHYSSVLPDMQNTSDIYANNPQWEVSLSVVNEAMRQQNQIVLRAPYANLPGQVSSNRK